MIMRQNYFDQYGSVQGGCCTDVVNGPYGVSMWKYIIRG